MNRAIHAAASQQAGVGSIHDGIRALVDDIAHHQLEHGRLGYTIAIFLRHCYLSDSASTPGNFLPSRNSSDAPPPVEMWVIWSATPAWLMALTESPPPMMDVAALLAATALAIALVPTANR